MKYRQEKMCDNVKVVQDTNYQWAVLDNSGNIIVPFGKFGWIDAFDRGLARVKSIASDHEEIYYLREFGIMFSYNPDTPRLNQGTVEAAPADCGRCIYNV